MKKDRLKNNPVDHPAHYTSHPSGIEAIEVCGRMGFCLGNAFKYLFRMENKWDALEDLKKARWYIDREAFQQGLSFKEWKEVKRDFSWDEDYSAIFEKSCMNSSIIKIVGSRPRNVEKALFYIYCADSLNIAERVGGVESALQCGKYYINRELRNRTQTKKGKGTKNGTIGSGFGTKA